VRVRVRVRVRVTSAPSATRAASSSVLSACCAKLGQG
jgi:hypothetical protein